MPVVSNVGSAHGSPLALHLMPLQLMPPGISHMSADAEHQIELMIAHCACHALSKACQYGGMRLHSPEDAADVCTSESSIKWLPLAVVLAAKSFMQISCGLSSRESMGHRKSAG